MQIIPALYIKDGKVAAYRPGLLHDIDYLDQGPYEQIDQLNEQGIGLIHLLDVDGSVHQPHNNTGLIGSLCNTTVPDLLVGGGIHNMDYLKSLQYAGVDYFLLGSVVIDQPSFLQAIAEASDIRNERIEIAIDVRDGTLMYHGWQDPVENQTPVSLIRDNLERGFNRFVCTFLQTNHQTLGPKLDFYQHLVHTFPEAHFSAAGHIHTFQDIDDLKGVGVKAVLVGNEIYKAPELLDQIVAYNEREAQTDEG